MPAWAGSKFYVLVAMGAFAKQDITFFNTDISSSVQGLRFVIIPLLLASRLSSRGILNLVRTCKTKSKNCGTPGRKTA
jgi:hypothetical protein